MVHCVICSTHVSYHVFLVAVLNMLGAVQKLDCVWILKPTCSLFRYCSMVGTILFSIIPS